MNALDVECVLESDVPVVRLYSHTGAGACADYERDDR